MQFLITLITTLALAFTSVGAIYNYVPLKYFELGQTPRFGSTITTIQGSDTLSASRSIINTNFANLNNDKLEISAFLATTSIPTLSSIGTITTGIWNATAIGVDYGGTGTTSPSVYQVILGNGSRGLTVASSTGTTGQFLTSNGPGAYPSWQTSAVDGAIDYIWTGKHTFNATTTIAASSTTTTPIILNGLPYAFPSTTNASSTVLSTDGTGKLSWEVPHVVTLQSSADLLTAHDTLVTHNGTTYTMVKSIRTFLSGFVRLDVSFARTPSGAGSAGSYKVLLNGTTVVVPENQTENGTACPADSNVTSYNISVGAGDTIELWVKDVDTDVCNRYFDIRGQQVIATSTSAIIQ